MTIAVYGKKIDAEFAEATRNLFAALEKYGVKVIVYLPLLDYIKANLPYIPRFSGTFKTSDDLKDTDVMISLGVMAPFSTNILVQA
jgi:hypothetical protein